MKENSNNHLVKSSRLVWEVQLSSRKNLRSVLYYCLNTQNDVSEETFGDEGGLIQCHCLNVLPPVHFLLFFADYPQKVIGLDLHSNVGANSAHAMLSMHTVLISFCGGCWCGVRQSVFYCLLANGALSLGYPNRQGLP